MKEKNKIEKYSFWKKISAVATSSIKFGVAAFLISLAFICFFNLFEIMEGEFPWGEWIYFSFNIGIYSFMAWFVIMLFVVLLAKKANKK